MKKVMSILLVCMLLCGGLSAAAMSRERLLPGDGVVTAHPRARQMSLSVPDVGLVQESSGYVDVSLPEADAYLMNPGQPVLPRLVETVELPFGARNIQVEVTVTGTRQMSIEGQVQPAPAPRPLATSYNRARFPEPPGKDTSLYQSSELFPEGWYTYRVGCGLNGDMEHVTHVAIHVYPVRYTPASGILTVADGFEVSVTYDRPRRALSAADEYDMVIVAPEAFAGDLERLVEHKNSHGIATLLKTTAEIYQEYDGVDRPEQIKYFIKDALETYGISYVMLVGGLKSIWYAKPRDTKNYGVQGWHVPVRYSNLYSGEPGYPCDLYYADIYRAGGAFADWDSNGNGVFAEWTDENGQPEDDLDLYPDVAVGRLACRSRTEVTNMVDKIIAYEGSTYGSDWFDRMLVVSGDGFMDQQDLDIRWDTSGLPDGDYVIHAQSSNPAGDSGPVDVVNVTVDRTAETDISFNHDDHLNPALQPLTESYPALPIAEICTVSEGDTLGSSDYTYTPTESEAYCNNLFWWANVSYVDDVLTIRGKSYDPQPYGNLTDIHVWITNGEGEMVFEDWRNDTETYYEGEWCTGEVPLHGRSGALGYMPASFERDILWTSNGKFTGQEDVIEAFSRGYGFAFFSGHGSPGYWGDQYPGIPGNRQHGSVDGLTVSQVSPFFPWVQRPAFPMNQLDNNGKYPVVVVGGCHNSLFNVSVIPSVLDIFMLLFFGKNIYMHTYGQPTPECWGWYIVKMPDTGAIASIGNTGFGWGWEGEYCTVGAGDGWITSEFFRQYGEQGYQVLGTAHSQTITTYISHHRDFRLLECWWNPDRGWDWIDEKTVQQWVLLGDPSLQMGGYP